MDTFIQMDVNPAKVVALFPPAVSGRLSVAPEEWIPLFGGPSPKTAVSSPPEVVSGSVGEEKEKGARKRSGTVDSTGTSPRNASPMGSIRETLKTGIESIIPAVRKDDDTASIRSKRRAQTKGKRSISTMLKFCPKIDPDQFSKQSIETLLRYLSDRRPQIDKALATHLISPSQASSFPPLSVMPTSELFDLQDLPFPSLTPAQLVHVAQVVYTALFKSYLIIRPGLLGPLCRTPNWCEVEEVEEELTAREVRCLLHMLNCS
jgi:Vam6/Vps39-like protein vacuolar protein sorting-associated protein 39